MLFRPLWILFLCAVFQVHGSIFDWFSPLSEKARRAQFVLEGIGPVVDKAIKDYDVPGVAIGVVVDGHLVYAKGFGYRDVEKKLPVTKETVFPIGSCTKAFTAFMVGTLVDEGLVYWDQKIVDVYPAFRLFDSYATQNLTFRDLLTHRCGLARHDFMWYNSLWTKSDVMERLRYLEPCCDLRERYVYNNLMYFAVGYALEYLTGKSWEELVQEKILTPLNMRRTSFSLAEMYQSEDYAFPYIEKDGRLEKVPFRDISLIGPAGALNSNVSDLSHWVQMQLNGGVYNDVLQLSPSLLQEIQTPQVIVPGAPETRESQIYAYGMGWCIAAYRGQYFLSHDGVSDGFTSTIVLLPLQNVGVIVLCNRNLSCFPRVLSCQLVDRVLELPPIDWIEEGLQRLQKAVPAEEEQDHLRKKGTVPSHPLSEFVGFFEHPGYGTVAIDMEGDQLRATLHGIVSYLDHWHYDVFRIAKEDQPLLFSRVGTKITFRTNWHGEVDELSIPFEPSVPDIVFKRQKKPIDLELSYYRKFLGFYEIYGYTVEIAIRNHALCAVISGQPVYELIPGAENEFTVQAMAGYNLRFVMGSDGKVSEVLLIQPYGTFTARPKKGVS